MAVITINHLAFGWNRDSQVLDIPSLVIEAGEKVLIKGPSGSGKSSLLSLLAGITVPDSGDVSVLGQSTQDLGASQRDTFRANHIGYIFQQFNLLPYLTVAENILLPLRFSATRRQRAGGDTADIARKLIVALGLPENLLSRPVTALSIGQQQRVAAARALIGEPELLIADEPTSALDTDTRRQFIDLLMDECHRAGSTLVFVSHDPALTPCFDRTIELLEINRVRGQA
ncbi:ATP-binding cassette domain-containing protein [Parasalinivibrio latis]|uniref:ATP-binding cassette domain-containing protein n=1 Tax=Parasalinivibrio latis TaxID=2952610 RepID=UPI0030E46995